MARAASTTLNAPELLEIILLSTVVALFVCVSLFIVYSYMGHELSGHMRILERYRALIARFTLSAYTIYKIAVLPSHFHFLNTFLMYRF